MVKEEDVIVGSGSEEIAFQGVSGTPLGDLKEKAESMLKTKLGEATVNGEQVPEGYCVQSGDRVECAKEVDAKG